MTYLGQWFSSSNLGDKKDRKKETHQKNQSLSDDKPFTDTNSIYIEMEHIYHIIEVKTYVSETYI